MSHITTPTVRGVPAFFVRNWLTGNLTLLGGVLAVIGAIDLFLALSNLAMGNPLTALINLVLGAIEVTAAAVILRVWKPDAEMLGRVSTACMVAMWLTAVWTAITFIEVFGVHGILAVLGAAVSVIFMMMLGSASAVIKAKAMSTY